MKQKEFTLEEFDQSLLDHAFDYNFDLANSKLFNDIMLDGYDKIE